MNHLLHLDASPRGERSVSRTLTKEFIIGWQAAHPGDIVTYRDIGHYPVPMVTESWIAAAFSSPEQHTPEQTDAIRISNDLIDEFLTADCYVFGVPMHNFSIPATFKGYVDQIVRVGRTFSRDADGYKGLVNNKKMLIITARGGSYPEGTPFHAYDFQEPYLRLIFGFMGITDIKVVHADNLMEGDELRAESIAKARIALKETIASW